LHKERRKRNHQPIDDALMNRTDTNEPLKQEQIEALYAVIKKLNTIEKGIILLYLEGRPYDEIAAITGFSCTNIGTRLNRIRQKITVQIKK